jgi:hypothetical protein
MANLSSDHRQIAFWLTLIFAILGGILLAIALYDDSTTADKTAMGCFGISFTAVAIVLIAVVAFP